MEPEWTVLGVVIVIVIITGYLGILYLVWNKHQIETNKRVDHFEDLDRQYDEVMEAIPDEILNNPDLAYKECVGKDKNFQSLMEKYFRVFQEEYRICLKERLSKDRWTKWYRQFESIIKKRWGYEAWKDLASHMELPDYFMKFVEKEFMV